MSYGRVYLYKTDPRKVLAIRCPVAGSTTDMRNLSRVVWSEGMYLGPQHFQVQNRYFEDSIRFVTSALWFAPYGLVGYGLDAEALRNGTLAATHARGIFPDGLGFHMPDSDPLPAPRNIVDLFPAAR